MSNFKAKCTKFCRPCRPARGNYNDAPRLLAGFKGPRFKDGVEGNGRGGKTRGCKKGKVDWVGEGRWRGKRGGKGEGVRGGMFASIGFGRINAHGVCPNVRCVSLSVCL